MRFFTSTALALLLICGAAHSADMARTTVLTSPDGKIKVTAVSSDAGLTWAVERDGLTVLEPSRIQIIVDGKELLKGTAREAARQEVNAPFASPVYKKAVVEDHYTTVTLRYGRDARVEFRAYDDGAAYRILSDNAKATKVDDECVEYRFSADYQAFVPYVNDNRGGERYCFSFESYYDEVPLSKMYADSLAITPLAVCLPGGVKAIPMDAGVEDYPAMMLLKGAGNSLKAEFPPVPGPVTLGGYNRLNLVPDSRKGCIAEVDGAFATPWRAVVVTARDADILDCDMAQRLAPACRIDDTSWIRPGKVAWDWWNNNNITGVDFEAGMNTATYKAYIDFASANGIEYIIVDAGWSGGGLQGEGASSDALLRVNPAMDIDALVAYGRSKGVDVILWSSWVDMIGGDPVNGYDVTERMMAHYSAKGIKGFKVDFVDRDDQVALKSLYRIAEIGAKYHMLLDYHGMHPTGLQRAYPNVINFEGVKGMENSKWEQRGPRGPVHDQPRYDVTAPYLRMLAGPMDYTPGSMSNALRDSFFGNNNHPMSQGTRVHQLAMYTIFEAPLQMLSDSPNKYMREQECTDFIAKVPTVFDEMVALDGGLGEYIVLARRKGDTWYVAAMTDWTPRDLVIDLSFLGAGSHSADIFADGVNAHRDAEDYKHTVRTVSASDKMNVHLAAGGGWTAIIRSL